MGRTFRASSLIFIAALLAGVSYCAAAWLGWHGPWITVWKGLGVGLLALWAAVRLGGGGIDRTLVVLLLLAGATGDVLLDAVGLAIGALAFLVGHVLASTLYLRNRRPEPSPSQKLLGRLTPSLTVVIAVALTWRTDAVMAIGIYSAALGVMAGTAWLSRFPRYRVGIGAILFVASDLLMFSRGGPLAGSLVPTALVWPLYFAGQALIARGLVATLAGEQEKPA